MTFSPETLQSFKDWYKEKGGSFESEYEAQEALSNLVGYFDLLIQWDMEEKKKLSNSTKPQA